MSTMPSFLKIGTKPNAGRSFDETYHLQDYKPLLGIWLIDLSVTRHWVDKPPCGSLGGTFCDRDFIEITGLHELVHLLKDEVDFDDEDEVFSSALNEDHDDGDFSVAVTRRKSGGRPKRDDPRGLKTKVMSMLKRQRKALLEKGVSADLPLFQNVERLRRMVSLSDAESAVLTFAASMGCFPTFRAALETNQIQVTDEGLTSLLSTITGQSKDLIRKALKRDSVLLTSGLIRIQRDEEDLETKITLVRDLQGVMLDQLASDDELGRRVLRPAKPGTLTLHDFPHLERDATLLLNYLAGVDQTRASGSNILLYGPPGTGKTEFAKALAAGAGLNLFDIGFADDDGNPIDGEERLHSFNFCQRALKGKDRVALLFDEVEDVLPGRQSRGLFSMLLGDKSDATGGKAWINRSLEENPVPTIWITNNANIDTAYLRRFDYALALRIPPRKVRNVIALEHLGQYAPDTAAVAAVADLDDLLPSQLERAARVARLSGLASPGLAWQHAEMALQSSRAVLGQSRRNLKAQSHTLYSLDYLNTDADIGAIICGLRVRPQASICLYGPSGTGKSQLARHIADELGKTIVIKRASDLLDKYVGGTEKRIAAMFEQALDEDGVLLLDEADSFLSDRNGAERHWEITQTNELLTQLECFEGLFFATTNLMVQFDRASLRRFSHKICFDYLNTDQRLSMFLQEFCRGGGTLNEAQLVADQVKRIEGLTAGDFSVIAKKRVGLSQPMTATEFLRLLHQEASVKLEGKGKMGF